MRLKVLRLKEDTTLVTACCSKSRSGPLPPPAVLRDDGDELLHRAVRRVPSPGRAGPAGVEPSPGLPAGASQVHEHGGTDETGGSQVRLKSAPFRTRLGVSVEGWEGGGGAITQESRHELTPPPLLSPPPLSFQPPQGFKETVSL